VPSIVALRNAMSTNLIARLAAAGYPPLADGKILLGKQNDYQAGSPPRVILTPTGSPFAPVDVYSLEPGLVSDEGRAQNQQQAIWTELLVFECRCWAKSASVDPAAVRDDEYDQTQALYHAVLQSLREVCGPFTDGGVMPSKGSWTDATFGAAQQMAFGREFVFGFQVPIPILDTLYPYAPPDVAASTSTTLTRPDGVTGPGCGS
jgi:hypothetical protein